VIPDTGGPIAEIVLHFKLDMESELEPAYYDLFNALPADVRFQIICPSSVDAEGFLLRWGPEVSAGGRQVQVVNVDCPITIWARDRRIARQSAYSAEVASTFAPASVPDYEEDKCGELMVTRLLASEGLIPDVVGSDLHIEGGNVVSNHRHAFIGANVFEENAATIPDRRCLHQELMDLTGRQYLALSDEFDRVPWCHVDMYVTPVDESVVLVASPALAQRILLSDVVSADADVFFGFEKEVLRASSTAEYTLAAIASQLADSGYRVIRLPAVMDPNEKWMVTYNNVLMERRNGQRVVYMPAYCIPDLDHAAVATYEALGFAVHTIDVSTIYEGGGVVRCLANVTSRRPIDTRVQPPVKAWPSSSCSNGASTNGGGLRYFAMPPWCSGEVGASDADEVNDAVTRY
jgi:N-dimethylarginine dimethylaminohydrolase